MTGTSASRGADNGICISHRPRGSVAEYERGAFDFRESATKQDSLPRRPHRENHESAAHLVEEVWWVGFHRSSSRRIPPIMWCYAVKVRLARLEKAVYSVIFC